MRKATNSSVAHFRLFPCFAKQARPVPEFEDAFRRIWIATQLIEFTVISTVKR